MDPAHETAHHICSHRVPEAQAATHHDSSEPTVIYCAPRRHILNPKLDETVFLGVFLFFVLASDDGLYDPL